MTQHHVHMLCAGEEERECRGAVGRTCMEIHDCLDQLLKLCFFLNLCSLQHICVSACAAETDGKRDQTR